MLSLDTVMLSAAAMRPLPATTSRLAHLLSDADVDLREVAKVVAFDAPLTARLLRTANSSLYGGRVTIVSVDQAVTRLGSGVVLSLALSATLKRDLMSGLDAYGMREGDLWKRSIAAALGAESLKVVLTRISVPPVTYTAALLHDIGRLVMARFIDADAKSAIARVRRESGASVEVAEMQVLGVHHAQLGAAIAQRWNLPKAIAHAIEFCHDPDAGAERLKIYTDSAQDSILEPTCDGVHFADAIGRTLTAAEPDALDRVSAGAMSRLGCDAELLKRAAERSAQRFEETLAVFG
jgi:putative nucleotidyltransferase with HDIG domain